MTGARLSNTGTAWVAALLGAGLAFVWASFVGQAGLWTGETAALAGRAMLAAGGQAEPAMLLVAYPQLPYLIMGAAALVSDPIGIHPASLSTGALMAGLAATYGLSLRRAGFTGAWVGLLMALALLNPLTIEATARGPEGMLVLWGVWLLGSGLFGLRQNGGVNDILAVCLSLPVLALSGLQGLVLALFALPTLTLAVPPQLRQKNMISLFLVLAFPLMFAAVAVVALSAILFQDPLAFVTPEVLTTIGGLGALDPERAGLALATAAVGLSVVFGFLGRTGRRLPLRNAALALATPVLAAAFVCGLVGFVDSALDAALAAVAAGMVATVRWPPGERRLLRVGTLSSASFAVLVLLISVTNLERGSVTGRVLGADTSPYQSDDHRFGRFLASRDGVTFDALAHPAVVSARGRVGGLVAGRSVVFQHSMLARRPLTTDIAVRAHRPGVSDDAVSRNMPGLYEDGAAGYRLIYDRNGWRVYSRDRQTGGAS